MRKNATLAASMLLVAALAGCSSDERATASGGDASSDSLLDGKTVGWASPVAAQPSQQLLITGMEDAATTLGADVGVYDSNISADTHVSNLQTMIQKKVAVIGTWTLDEGAVAGIYTQAGDAGIPVIGANSSGTGVVASVYYETQTCEPGGPASQTAELYAAKYPGGSVITIGLDGVPTIDADRECFTAAAEAAGLKIVAHVSNNTDDAAGSQKLTADLLTKYPDANAIWAYNDSTALGASAAVLSAGYEVSDGSSDGILIVGSNGDADAIQAVREDRLTGTWDPNPYEFGWLMLKVAEESLEGDVPERTVLKSTFLDKATLEDYVEPADRDVSFDNLQVVE